MLYSGKNFALCATRKINILTLVLSEKKILNETKNHNPPFKLNGQSLIPYMLNCICPCRCILPLKCLTVYVSIPSCTIP